MAILVATGTLLASAPAQAQTLNGLNSRWTVIPNNSNVGFGLEDGSILAPLTSDAFDRALGTSVNGTLVAGTLSGVSAPGNGELIGLNASQTIGNFSVNKSLLAHATSPSIRTLLELTNTSGTTQAASIIFTTNVGSDGTTQVITTFSGDTVFTPTDQWLVTDDAFSDPTNVHYLFGANAAVTPSSVTQTVFSASGTEGVSATYAFNVLPGQTVSLMWINQIWPTASEATASAPGFNTLEQVQAAGLLSDLSSTQINQIANWGRTTASTAPEPGTLAFLATGMLALGSFVRRRRSA